MQYSKATDSEKTDGGAGEIFKQKFQREKAEAISMTTRQRRPLNFDPSWASTSESQSYGKHGKPGTSDGDEEADKGLGFFLPVFALGMLRYMSAT